MVFAPRDPHPVCPKCHAVSGDSWSQCRRLCPMYGSPYYVPDLWGVRLYEAALREDR
jgi:hypothetical protein